MNERSQATFQKLVEQIDRADAIVIGGSFFGCFRRIRSARFREISDIANAASLAGMIFGKITVWWKI